MSLAFAAIVAAFALLYGCAEVVERQDCENHGKANCSRDLEAL